MVDSQNSERILAKHIPCLQSIKEGNRLWYNEVRTIPSIFHEPICNRLGVASLKDPPPKEHLAEKLNRLRLIVFEIMPREVETEFMKQRVGTFLET